MAETAGLTRQQEAIIPVAAFAAAGDIPALEKALVNALDAGLTVNEIKEILIQLYAYAGFPRSLTALGEFMKLEGERKAKGLNDPEGEGPRILPKDANRNETGTKIQTQLVGKPVAGPLFDFAPGIDAFLKEHLFCDIFSRGVLSNEDRELATISILAALPAPAQLESHLNICKNVGLTRGQMQDYVKTLANMVGEKPASVAAPLVAKVFPAAD